MAVSKLIQTIVLTTIFLSFAAEAQPENDYEYEIITMDGSNAHLIQLVNANTGVVQQFTDFNGYAPNWSPNGEKIAIRTARGGISYLRILNIPGNTMSEWSIAYAKTQYVYDILWSPSGDTIALSRCWMNEPNGCNIDLLEIEQGNIRQLAQNFPQDALVTLSPDFKKIFYAPENASGTHPLGYVFDIQTGATDIIIEHGKYLSLTKWSPDSKRIAFSDCDFFCAIYSVNADGTNLKKLVNYRKWLSDYSWSPDSQSIAFSSGAYGYEQAFVVDVDTLAFKSIFAQNLGIRFPQFSPDGKKVAFLSCAPRGQQTCTLNMSNVDGTNLITISELANEGYVPGFVWRPQPVSETS
jgi:Tol biopolymer transport system component